MNGAIRTKWSFIIHLSLRLHLVGPLERGEECMDALSPIPPSTLLAMEQCVFLTYETGYGKRAHLAQELIFQKKQLKFVTPVDFVHNSNSVKCYNFCQEAQFFKALKCI